MLTAVAFMMLAQPVKTVRALAGRLDTTCAVISTGELKCWGANTWGQLGLGDWLDRGIDFEQMGQALPAVALGSGRTVKQVSVGSFFTCAILDDGAVKCWGLNKAGQLGVGDVRMRGRQPDEMGDQLAAVKLGADRSAAAIAAGDFHSCALLDNGSVKCWGEAQGGRLGLEDQVNRGGNAEGMGDALPAVNLGTNRQALAVCAGAVFSCAMLDDHSVKCWGDNKFGSLGTGAPESHGDVPGSMGDNLPAVDLGPGAKVKAISCGNFHACALLSGGAVKCWGYNNSGELGAGDLRTRGKAPGDMGENLPVVNLGTGRKAKSLTVEDSHTCAVLDDDTLKCWGQNAYGQLGLEDVRGRGGKPGEMGDELPAHDFSGLLPRSSAGGEDHSCVLLSNGGVKCWGYNGFGQLGLGDERDRGGQPGDMADLPFIRLW